MTGDAASSGYFKIPFGRRRQMCAALLLNFFTGPLIFAICGYLLWCLMQPYSVYVFSLYFTYILVDNLLRPMPSRGRVCQVCACIFFASIIVLFRDALCLLFNLIFILRNTPVFAQKLSIQIFSRLLPHTPH